MKMVRVLTTNTINAVVMIKPMKSSMLLGPQVRGPHHRMKFQSLSSRSAKDVQEHLLTVLSLPRRGKCHALFAEAQARHPG
jgi:hypothetical protein